MFIEGKEIYEQNRRKVSCNTFSRGSSLHHLKEYASGLLKKNYEKEIIQMLAYKDIDCGKHA
jgi:hypothetical protein